MSAHDYSKVPQELKTLPQWCVYRLVPKNGHPEKFDKPPFQSLRPGSGCDSTNPAHWSTFDEAVKCVRDLTNKMSGIGFVLTPPYIGTDLDDCFNEHGIPSDSAYDFLQDLDTYSERSPSGNGLHFINKGKLSSAARKDGVEVYTRGRYFTVTGSVLADKPIRQMSDIEAVEHYEKVKRGKSPRVEVKERKTKLELLLNGEMASAGFSDPSAAVQSLLTRLAQKYRCDPAKVENDFLASRLYLETCAHWQRKWPRLRDRELAKAIEFARKNPAAVEINPDSWREGFYSFDQLPKTPPRFLLSGLVPEKALTAICAPSYNCKTWLALAMALAISKGRSLWCFDGPWEPVPVAYHVPEMNAALVRRYMEILGFEDSEMFLVKPMELGLLKLDDPRMLRSAEGRVNFFDTAGYFNPADDSSNYQQSLKFANLLYNLLQNGAVAVVALFHPPKYAKAENQPWTLENSILGSAGYGGILRSCLRTQNLNPDLNDPSVWLYIQGMKNPGLKPFQLEGPPPLRMKVPPSESPYLKDLNLSSTESDLRREKAFKGFAEGKTSRVLIKELRCSPRTLGDWRREWNESHKVVPDQSDQLDLVQK